MHNHMQYAQTQNVHTACIHNTQHAQATHTQTHTHNTAQLL